MKLRYFYKVNIDGTPIAGTLAAYRVKPTVGNWKEVPNNACCVTEPGEEPTDGCTVTNVTWYSGFAIQEPGDGLYLYIWSPNPDQAVYQVAFPQGTVDFLFENYPLPVQVIIDGELVLTIGANQGQATPFSYDMTGVCTFEMIPIQE